MANFPGNDAPNRCDRLAVTGEVVEIGLLIPSRRASALMDLSRRRGQSVGQLLRSLIDRALSDSAD